MTLVFAANAVAERMPPRDIVLVLDNSESMKRKDGEFALREAARGFFEAVEPGIPLAVMLFDRTVCLEVGFAEYGLASWRPFSDSLLAVDYSD